MNRKHSSLAALVCAGLVACGGGNDGNADAGDTTKRQPLQTQSPTPTQQQNPQGTNTLAMGQQIYEQYCATCHQVNGQGITGVYPPVANSDYLLADPKRSIGHVVHGVQGEITVNGQKFNGAMPPAPYDDAQIAAAMTYVLNAWGNKGGEVTEQQVADIRAAGSQK